MKRLLTATALTLLLSACGSQTARFSVVMDTTDPVRKDNLTAAIQRVVEGRMIAKKKTVTKQEIKEVGNDTVLTVGVSDKEAVQLLTEGLMAPFSMSVMKQVEEGQGDIISEKYGEFKEIGIVTEHFDWVTAGTFTVNGQAKGAVGITFTTEGEVLLKDMFKKNRGAVIGIFVRGQLMSKKLIEAKDADLTSIAIDGIPSTDLAAAFADDVNVGLHVIFTPLP